MVAVDGLLSTRRSPWRRRLIRELGRVFDSQIVARCLLDMAQEDAERKLVSGKNMREVSVILVSLATRQNLPQNHHRR